MKNTEEPDNKKARLVLTTDKPSTNLEDIESKNTNISTFFDSDTKKRSKSEGIYKFYTNILSMNGNFVNVDGKEIEKTDEKVSDIKKLDNIKPNCDDQSSITVNNGEKISTNGKDLLEHKIVTNFMNYPTIEVKKAIKFNEVPNYLLTPGYITEETICKDIPKNIKEDVTFAIEGALVIDSNWNIDDGYIGKQCFIDKKRYKYKLNEKTGKPEKIESYKLGNVGIRHARLNIEKNAFIIERRQWLLYQKNSNERLKLVKKIYIAYKTPPNFPNIALLSYGWYDNFNTKKFISHLETMDLLEKNLLPKVIKKEDPYFPSIDSIRYFRKWPLYSHQEITPEEAYSIVLMKKEISNDLICHSVPQCYGDIGTFIIDNVHLTDPILQRLDDGHDNWGGSNDVNIKYFKFDTENKQILQLNIRSDVPSRLINFDVKLYCRICRNNRGNGSFVRKMYLYFIRDWKKVAKCLPIVVVTYSFDEIDESIFDYADSLPPMICETRKYINVDESPDGFNRDNMMM
uniref:SET domain-containing protein n=1 Tax=Parastrongyloides trichosuri TaxID=131310 RepID=A0A0N4ZH22_PARTI